MSKVSSEVEILLHEHPWESTIPRLLLYARYRCRKLYWQGDLNGNMPGGKEQLDLVNQTVLKVMSGERQWHPRREPDLFRVLCGILRSEINHLAEGKENRSQIPLRLEPPPDKEGGRESGPSPPPAPPCTAEDPEKRLLNREKEHLAEVSFWRFHASLAEFPLLQQYVLYVYHDIDKPGMIAQRMQCSPREIYNMQRQLRRKLSAYLDKERPLANRKSLG